MLQASGVNKRHWLQAVMYACEIDNRTLPTVRGSSMTCFEAFYGVSSLTIRRLCLSDALLTFIGARI
eukprot:2121271-Rhodomonas_salina.1